MTVAMTANSPWFRGAIDRNRSMETLQIAYLHAVVAAAGCSLSSPSPDNGVDWIVSHEGSHQVDPEPSIKVALKATQQIPPNPTGPDFGFSLSRQHFDKLAVSPVTITRLLIVMIVPAQMEDWITSTSAVFVMRHRCYWVNLLGHASNNKGTQTVRVPTANVFDDEALCEILCEVGRGGVPR